MVFGSKEGPNIENWRVKSLLRGHSNNVVDIAWSYDSSMIASASLDNCIFVWNPENGKRLKLLEGHTSFVKGLLDKS